MGQNTNPVKLPFSNVSDLSLSAQVQIRRNFEHLAGLIPSGGTATIYDALIDPAQTTSAANHVYKNLTDLVANETLLSTRTFTVGVIPRNNVNIQETAPITLNGPIAIAALGSTNTGLGSLWAVGSRVRWDLNNKQITSTNVVWVAGLDICNLSAVQMTSAFAGANCVLNLTNCRFQGDDDINTNRRITAPTAAGIVYAQDCYFQSCQFNNSIIAVDCHYSLTAAMPNFTINPNGNDVYWDGGTFQNHNTGAITITFSGTSVNHHLRWTRGIQLDGSTAAGTHVLSFSNTGKNDIELDCEGNQFDVTITSAAGDTRLLAFNIRDLTVSSGGAMRHVTGSNTRAVSVNNGKTVLNWIQNATTGLNNQVILSGAGISGVLLINNSGTNPWLKVVGCTDTSLQVTFASPTIGSQAYTIDATSARCYFQTAGSSHANFSVASTNAGTNTRVGTEAAIN